MMQERNARHPGGIAALGFAALGVVFGDIGTSPLYTPPPPSRRDRRK
jgi:K+ transporter